MASADRSPVCMCVRYGGAGQVHVPHPAAARAGVSSACTAGASFSSSRDPVHEPAALHQRGGLAADPGHPPGRDRDAGHLAQQHRGPAAPGRTARRPGSRPARMASGPKLARARTNAGSSPSLTASHHGHCLACATYSVTSGGGAGPMSVTWWRRCAGAPARPPGPCRTPGTTPEGTRTGVVRVIDELHRRPRLARLLPRPPLPPLPQRPVPALLLIRAVRRRRPRRRRRIPARPPLQGSSTRACPAVTLHAVISSACAVSPAITRYASASRAASSACGSAASSSAEGTPGTSGTTGNHHHPGPPSQPPATACRAGQPALQPAP